MKFGPRTTIVLALILASVPAAAQSAQDSAAIRSTALDYIDGWWSGDAQRMASALHAELVKRIRGADPSGGLHAHKNTAIATVIAAPILQIISSVTFEARVNTEGSAGGFFAT